MKARGNLIRLRQYSRTNLLWNEPDYEIALDPARLVILFVLFVLYCTRTVTRAHALMKPGNAKSREWKYFYLIMLLIDGLILSISRLHVFPYKEKAHVM